jgi:hypothetical protein
MRNYGYNDPELVRPSRWKPSSYVALFFAVLFVVSVWLALDQKLLFGEDWLSQTYDNEDWRTNEGNLHTYGAWDLEAHIWKTEYILKYFPHFQWNPYWYLGMPLLKYYQAGFYIVHALIILATGMSAARAATMMVIFGHLLATLLTFLLCYKVSRRIWVSALCCVFLLSNTFISLRSYGWEPITVVFLFLYPLGLLVFLREPLRPFRFWMIIVLALSYICHPLLFFSLCMFMGLYLFSAAISATPKADPQAAKRHYIWEYFAAILCAVAIGAIQFVPQITYEQVTSGAHMGVKYLPFYQVPPNIITLKDFLFDAGNLKGPGPIIMIAFLLLIIFSLIEYSYRKQHKKRLGKMVVDHEIIRGVTLVLLVMVMFYYMERFNIFPMNMLRSIQYHRIIPEFIITAAVLVAALSNIAYTYKQKVIYYTMLISFVLASFIIVYNVQNYWQTTETISEKEEFLTDKFDGRFTVPYTDQSLAVRNSFTELPQTYGYYEQGITNGYNDEVFSVSSGYHNANLTLLYLKATNVQRLYVNTEEGERDRIMMARLNGTVPFTYKNDSRYSYFTIPLKNPSFAQAVPASGVAQVENLSIGCRELFKEHYCESNLEEFVTTDPAEIQYLAAYVKLLDTPYDVDAKYAMVNPDHYTIDVTGAQQDTYVVVKMTYDEDFVAHVNGQKVPIERFGPDFMLIKPGVAGNYTIDLKYSNGVMSLVAAAISVLSLAIVSIIFLFKKLHWLAPPKSWRFRKGDMR